MRTLFTFAINPFMSSTDLAGITASSTRWQVLAALIAMSECFVNRVIETPRGFLLAGSVPGEPNTAAIYLYDEPERRICQIGVGEAIDDFSDEELDRILPELVQMLRALPRPTKSAAKPGNNRRHNHRHNGRHNRRHNHRVPAQNTQKQPVQTVVPSAIPIAA